jgi:hypothetical protein
MFDRVRVSCVTLLCLCALVLVGLPRTAEAGTSEALLALAGPLAEQFGVPAGPVTSLLESGISLESVTQLLLVNQSSKAGLDNVTKLYRDSGNDITKTAETLDVASSAYSKEKVTAAIDEAKASASADATQKATDEANKAIGDALGGFGR